MRKPLPPDTSVDDIELAFYEALQMGDIEAVMACWADEDDIVCVHPNGQRLLGHAQIRDAYAALFTHGPLRALPVDVRLMSMAGCTVHSLLERLDVQTDDGPMLVHVQATNVYARTPKGWRLVLHHASPGQVQTTATAVAPSRTLH
jgi:ketosteroid isomerase-like protein